MVRGGKWPFLSWGVVPGNSERGVFSKVIGVKWYVFR